MNNVPKTHKQLSNEFKKLILKRPFDIERLTAQCTDIVVRERMKILTAKSHSDRCTGEWVSRNPHSPEEKY